MNRYTGTCLLFCLIFILRSTACALCAACTTAVMTKYLANPISPFKTSGKTKAVYMMELTVRLTPGGWGSFVRVIQYNTYGIGSPNQRVLNSRKPSEAGTSGEKFSRKLKCLDDSQKRNFAKIYEISLFRENGEKAFSFQTRFSEPDKNY